MGETIQLTASDGHQLDAYKADPEGPAKAGLVVIQEIFGVNVHIRDVCDRFAAQGYAVLAPAMFDRVQRGVELEYGDEDRARGRDVRSGCDWDTGVLDMAAALEFQGAHDRTGIVGYCWGGSLAWLAACRLQPAAAVTYYGGQIADFADEQPNCPVLLHFGELDASIPLDKVEAVRRAHPDLSVHVYPGAEHGFNCDRRASYNETAAKVALERTLSFFTQHLV